MAAAPPAARLNPIPELEERLQDAWRILQSATVLGKPFSALEACGVEYPSVGLEHSGLGEYTDRFEDYLARPSANRAVDVRTSWRGENGEEASGAWQTLSRIRDTLRSEEKKKLIQVARAQLEFIVSTSQCEEFEDYLKTFYRNPPPVIARFDTRDEAETWLRNLPEPPSSAYILVGNEYLEVFYSRERGVRALRRDYALERFIEAVTSRGLPVPVASFDAHAEAAAWWKSHPAPPLSVFVRIAGEHHLAVYHKKIDYRSLHPISILEDWRRRRGAGDGPFRKAEPFREIRRGGGGNRPRRRRLPARALQCGRERFSWDFQPLTLLPAPGRAVLRALQRGSAVAM